jgi:hypothetical protein
VQKTRGGSIKTKTPSEKRRQIETIAYEAEPEAWRHRSLSAIILALTGDRRHVNEKQTGSASRRDGRQKAKRRLMLGAIASISALKAKACYAEGERGYREGEAAAK